MQRLSRPSGSDALLQHPLAPNLEISQIKVVMPRAARSHRDLVVPEPQAPGVETGLGPSVRPPDPAPPRNFAEELSRLTQMHGGTKVESVLDYVRLRCKDAAKRGFHHAEVCYLNFSGSVDTIQNVREGLDLLGLIVKEVKIFQTSLFVTVEWARCSDGPRQKKQRQLEGNLELQCNVCMNAAKMKRLHPCGHLLGSCCSSRFVGSNCPFCRLPCTAEQCVFKP